MDGWLTIYSAVVSLLATSVTLVGRNVRPRAAVDAERGVAVLTYPRGFVRIARIAAIVTVAGLVMALVGWPRPVETHPNVIYAMFGLLAAAAVAWAWMVGSRVEVGEDGVAAVSASGKRTLMAWQDVRDVTFRSGWFVLRAEGGRKLRINSNRNGMKTWIEAMGAALPRKAYIGSVGDYNAMKRNMPAGG